MRWPNTERLPDGKLVTRAKSRVDWAQIARNGRTHIVVGVIIRWNFHGGTFNRPDVTFVMACGPQRHVIVPDPNPDPINVCARCDSRSRLDSPSLFT